MIQAAEQNNLDPDLAKKKRKRKAPAPPNPFTGEVEEEKTNNPFDGEPGSDEETEEVGRAHARLSVHANTFKCIGGGWGLVSNERHL